jgi:hypothetical protein
MDKVEARVLLKAFVEDLQQQPYSELVRLIRNPVCVEMKGPSGTPYQIEYESLWDSEPNGLLRIMASIDNGGLISAMFPITLCFLVDSDEIVQA